jgi:predicted ArsR family transcriptional regulator
VAEPSSEERAVDQFILDKIDSVPHLEALLLLWNSRPAEWSAEELAKRLYVDRSLARKLLEDLTREEIVVRVPGSIGQFWEKERHGGNRLSLRRHSQACCARYCSFAAFFAAEGSYCSGAACVSRV